MSNTVSVKPYLHLHNRARDLRFIDLFAGIGGFRLTFESFGARCVFSSE